MKLGVSRPFGENPMRVTLGFRGGLGRMGERREGERTAMAHRCGTPSHD